MRISAKCLAALGLIGAAAVSVPVLTMPTAAAAQIYFDGPGFGFGVGPRWYGERHYGYYNEPYGYYGRPYWRYHHHYRW